MRRSASEVISELEVRVAHLEKKAFIGGIKSKINDVYTKLLRKIPLEAHRKKYIKEVCSRLNKAIKRHGNKEGISKVSLSSSESGLKITYTLNGKEKDFIVENEDKLRHIKTFVATEPGEVGLLSSIYQEVKDDTLFFVLLKLKGDTDGLYDQLKDTNLLLRAEKKFWEQMERTSSVGAKVLKALVKIGVGVALFKLIMAGFILVGGGSAIVGILLTALVGAAVFAFDKANSLPKEVEYRQKRAQRVDEEEVLENFLELLEQEGLA
jgi:hypothetical protein